MRGAPLFILAPLFIFGLEKKRKAAQDHILGVALFTASTFRNWPSIVASHLFNQVFADTAFDFHGFLGCGLSHVPRREQHANLEVVTALCLSVGGEARVERVKRSAGRDLIECPRAKIVNLANVISRYLTLSGVTAQTLMHYKI